MAAPAEQEGLGCRDPQHGDVLAGAIALQRVAMALERNPAVAAEIARSGFEVACHGHRWIDYQCVPEAAERAAIGVDKILIGSDYPHHEGTWGNGPGTTEYLRATLGAAAVPAGDARLMLGENAIDVFGFDRAALRGVADGIGADLKLILTPPTQDFFPRGDVHKPLATAF